MPEILKNRIKAVNYKNDTICDFEVSNYPKNDCLKLLRLLCFDIFEITLVKISLLIIVYLSLLITLAQVHLFLQKFDFKFFIQYAPTAVVLQFVTVSCWGILFVGTYAIKRLKVMRIYLPKNKKDEIFIKMKRESKKITFIIIGLLLLGIMSGFVVMVHSEKDEDLYLIYSLIKDFMVPAWKKRIALIFSVNGAVCGYIALANFWQFIYGSYHVKYQIEITLNCIRKIDALCKDRTCRCEQHQQQIKDYLKFLILRQNNLLNYGNFIIKKIWPLILSYSLFGGLLIISMLFLLLTIEVNVILYVKMIPIFITGILVGIFVIIVGQNLVDLSVMSFNELCKLKWYNWNEENKKIYLIMLTNHMIPFKIKFSENIAINYALGLSICKTVYSVVSVLIQMRNAKF